MTTGLQHFNVIAEINLEMFNYLLDTNAREERIKMYAQKWMKFEKLTNISG